MLVVVGVLDIDYRKKVYSFGAARHQPWIQRVSVPIQGAEGRVRITEKERIFGIMYNYHAAEQHVLRQRYI